MEDKVEWNNKIILFNVIHIQDYFRTGDFLGLSQTFLTILF